ncbi:SMC family ATPase [Alkalinema sp. FACHB-956]|uniref:AAA family ATPase n=1 Tax=Alkalinema sp. FACHB-956 TaxID=2692768 RepID=UPI001687A660|nr:SMC family ATPase [Alkalinema sp. FACHB-956]MBD2326542.1 SMC family ATPase [Alkalinema sp. FACHB-956]
MIPLQLKLNNFLSYREATLDFRGLHTACISGANGAGKSSLLEAISWAIWGESRAAVEDDIIHFGESETRVEFLFCIHNHLYRVIRSRHRGQGMILEFQIALDPLTHEFPQRFRPLTEKGLRATQQFILEHVKLDYDTFINSAYLRQGRADEFMLKRPSDRKQILADLLKLQQYDELAEKAKEQARQFKAEVDALERQQTSIDQQLSQLQNLETQQAELEQHLSTLQEQQIRDRKTLQTLQTQQHQREIWQQQLQWHRQQYQQHQQDCQRLQKEYQQAEESYQAIVALLQAEEAIYAAYLHSQELQAQEEFLANRFQLYQDLQTRKQQYLNQHQQRLNELQQQQQQLWAQTETLRDQMEENQHILSHIPDVEAGLANLQSARQQLEQFDSIQLQVAPLLQRKQQLQRSIDQATARVTARLEELRTTAKQMEQQQSQQPQLQQAVVEVCDRIDELDKLRKYQERVREKGLERRNFMERLQAHQRDYEAQLAEVDQILRLLKHRSEDAHLTTELQAALLRHHDEAMDMIVELADDNPASLTRDRAPVTVQEATGNYTSDNYASGNYTSSNHASSNHASSNYTSGNSDLDSTVTNPTANLADFPPCPLCDRPLDEHHWELVVQKHLAKQQEILEQIWVIREQLAVSEREIQVLRQEYRDIEKRLEQYGSVLERRGQLQEQLQVNESSRQSLDQLLHEVQHLEHQLLSGEFAPDLQEELRLLDHTLDNLNYDDRNHAIARGLVDRWRWAEIKQAEIKQAQRRQTQIEHRLPELQAQQDDCTAQIAQLETTLAAGLAQYDQHLADLGYSLEQHNALRAALKQVQASQLRYQELQQAQQQYPHLRQRLEDLAESLQTKLVSLESVGQQCQYLEKCLAAAPEPTAQIQQLEQKLQRERQTLDATLSRLGQLQQQQQQRSYLLQDQVTLQRSLQTTRQQYRIYQELVQAFGKNGIQALMIENVLPQLETLANQILTRLTNNQLHVQFVTQKRNAKGKLPNAKLAETLDIVIADAKGTRPYETYSGGEAFRINFAIRLALARLLSQRSGTALQMLIVDEGFGTQDQEGCDRLIAAINAIAPDFACILTVTHMPYFRDAFQSRIEVHKTETGSQLAFFM